MDWIVLLIAGMGGGVMLGMIGVGAALITVPLLAFLLPGMDVPADQVMRTALATSMAVVAATSVSSVLAHHRRGNVDWASVKVLASVSILGVAAGVLLASVTPDRALQVVFGCFMIIAALRMAHGAWKAGSAAEPEVETPRSRLILATGGGLIGFSASFIGGGGGVFMVPFLHWCGLITKRAVGTSTAAGLPVAVAGAAVFIAAGWSEAQVPGVIGYLHLPALLCVGLGGLVAAPLGARLAAKLPARLVRAAFAVVVSVIAVKMLVS